MSLTYLLYRLGGAVVPRIPPALGYQLCAWLGGVLYQVYKPGRMNIQANLRRVLGPQVSQAEINRRGRATFCHLLYNFFDLFRLPNLDDKAIERLLTVSGWENVEVALAQGRGIVMISIHLGNIETVLYAILQRGSDITIPVMRMEPPEVFDYVCALRLRKGLKLVPADGSLLELIRVLKKGGIAGIAADRNVTQTGQIIDFFGYPAHLPDGYVRLAVRMNVPLVVGFSHRNLGHTHQAYFLPPFYPPAQGSEEERVRVSLKYVISEMEKAIAQYPEQWTTTVAVSIWGDSPDL
ncbi:MAG: lysophospholipid acyltransferase family protein [Anaerolineales bacterium]|nr:lysophospholipid acyltransferase family protein [Anaerolineales bacterium]